MEDRKYSYSTLRRKNFYIVHLVVSCFVVANSMAHALTNKVNISHRPSTSTVIKGTNGPVGSVNGIDFNLFNQNDNKIYGASTIDGKIFTLDSNTGRTIDTFGLTEGVISPDDVVVAPNGDIYYTDTLIGQIKKIDPATRQSTVVASGLPLINSIRFSTDGAHLYAGQCFNVGGQNGLWEIDLSGGGNNRLITDSLDTSPILGSLCSLNSFDFKNGFIYGPRIFTGDVVRVNPETGAYDVVAAGFVNPGAVQFSESGKLYVTDAYNNRLMRIDYPELNNQTPSFVAKLSGERGIDNLAVKKHNSQKDYIYVSSGNDGYIEKVDSTTGNIVDAIKHKGLVLPLGLAFASNGNLLLGDFNTLREVNTRLKKVVKSTATTADLTGNSINRPFGVAKFGENVVLADWFGKAIQVWDYNNNTPLAHVSPENTPINVMEYQGTIISAQFNQATNTATIVQHSGENYAVATTLVTQAAAAFTGLATNGEKIWIADALNGKVYEYVNGTLVTIAQSLSSPEGIALDKDKKHLLVIEVGTKKLSSINLNGQLGSNVRTIEQNLPVGYSNGFAAPFYFVTGIAVDPCNRNIYYAGDAGRVLNVIKRRR